LESIKRQIKAEGFKCEIPQFHDRRERKPLQAADILVYETWKYYCNELEENPRRPRWTLVRLDEIPFRWTYVGEEALLGVLEKRRLEGIGKS
jgi:hypothetical protein